MVSDDAHQPSQGCKGWRRQVGPTSSYFFGGRIPESVTLIDRAQVLVSHSARREPSKKPSLLRSIKAKKYNVLNLIHSS